MAGNLQGLDPSDPRVRYARELVFGAGPAGGITSARPVCIWGNLTSSGTATADVISDPIENDDDAKDAGGARSEIYAMYRRFKMVAQDAEIRFMPVAESAGSAATIVISVATTATTTSGWLFELDGERIYYTPQIGDDDETTAKGIAAAFNSYDAGRLLLTAAAADSSGWKVTLTFSHKGTRGALYLGHLSVTALGTNATTVTVGAVSAGSTEDDWTNAIAAYAAYDGGYMVIAAKTATSAPSATDNGIGELQSMLTQQGAPSNGKSYRLFFGLVGTQAQMVAVNQAAVMNKAETHAIWCESIPHLPGVMAAYVAAMVRSAEMAYFAANINERVVEGLTAPYDKTDWLSDVEEKAGLNNGATPLVVRKNRLIVSRFITNKSLNDAGQNDYRSREGHIPSVVHAFWDELLQQYNNIRQPNVSADPADGQIAPRLTTTPSQVKATVAGVIRDFGSNAPLKGRQPGPLFDPAQIEALVAGINVTGPAGGRLGVDVGVAAVVHNLGVDTKIFELSAAY